MNTNLNQLHLEIIEESNKVYPNTRQDFYIINENRNRIESWLNRCENIEDGVIYFNKIKKGNLELDFEVVITDSDNSSDLTIFIYGWVEENQYHIDEEEDLTDTDIKMFEEIKEVLSEYFIRTANIIMEKDGIVVLSTYMKDQIKDGIHFEDIMETEFNVISKGYSEVYERYIVKIEKF